MYYSPSESESFLEKPSTRVKSRRSFEKLPLIGWLIALILFAILVYSNIFPAKPTDLDCTRQLNTWSPFLDSHGLVYEEVQFSIDFYQPSPYKGRPTPELELAWAALWDFPAINIPLNTLPSLNKSTSDEWYLTEEGGVLAGLETSHNLHCLDIIRQYTWRDKYNYTNNESFQGGDAFVREHIDHCIEALRIRLMCLADTTPFLHRLEPRAESGKTPDFNTQHRCINYEAIQNWVWEHRAKGAPGQVSNASTIRQI